MNRYLLPVLKLIAALTVVSGLLQMVRPQWVLAVVGGESTPTGNHFFAIVGMFMVLFGGLMWQALAAEHPRRMPLLWCGLQKLGATFAVWIGFSRELFNWLALAVASFDFVSCALIFMFILTLRNNSGEA